MNAIRWDVLKKVTLVAIAVGWFFASASAAQQATGDPGKAAASTAVDDYQVGPSDVLVISVPDAPEFGGKFRVSDSGVIEMPGVATPIHAEGQTVIELAHSVREALIAAKQLRDPRVSVFVDEYHGRTVTVLGAVAKPSVYPLTKHTSVVEALSLAGGTLPNSGNIVTVVRGAASAEASNTAPGSVRMIRLSDLVSGSDLGANIEVKNGDVVSVSAAQLIYVVGAVTKPGGFTIADPSSGISVVQAVALAEGLKGVAGSRGLILRQSTSDRSRTEIPVDLRQLMAGKSADVLLAPNDILFVPSSGARWTLKAMGDVAFAAVNGIAIYGIGYRVGGI